MTKLPTDSFSHQLQTRQSEITIATDELVVFYELRHNSNRSYSRQHDKLLTVEHFCTYNNKKPPTGGAGKTPRHLNSTQSRAKRSAVLSNFEKCRPEVANDVISGVVVE